MQEEIKETLPKNVYYSKNTYIVKFTENKKSFTSSNQVLTIALYYADQIIKKDNLKRKLFLTEDEFKECYNQNKVYFNTEDYFDKLDSVKIGDRFFINRRCGTCGTTNLVERSYYKNRTFKKNYPNTEYYRCFNCYGETIEGVPKTDLDMNNIRNFNLMKKSHNTSGYVGISPGTKRGEPCGFVGSIRNRGSIKMIYGKYIPLEEMVWLRDDYIRHMGFDNVLNLSDEVYFAQENKYKFNKKIDWRKSNN